MDLAITKVTPEYWRARGAKACDDGLSIEAQGLARDQAALAEWLRGYRRQELAHRNTAVARTELVRQVACHHLVGASA